jgi:hypothetical protein
LAIVAGGFAFVALVTAGLAMATRPALAPQPTATALVITVPAATGLPPATQPIPPTSPAPEPTFTVPPPPPGDEIRVGVYVQVIGTGDVGFLNLRAEASLDSPVNYLALEREVLQVQAGPADASGFKWWYLVNPTTNSFGWGVQNYLQVVPGP